MDINKLTEIELLQLKSEIEQQINVLRIKKDKSNNDNALKCKNKLSQLNSGDKIFGIGLSHSDLDVYFIDYCYIRGYNKTDNSEYHKIAVGHDIRPFGIFTSIIPEEYNSHHFLCDTCSITYFFTLKPETWEIDLKSDLEQKINLKKKYFNNEIKIFEKRINFIINNKKKIYNHINTLTNQY